MDRDVEATNWTVGVAVERASGSHIARDHMRGFMWNVAEETSDVVTEAINSLLHDLTYANVEDAINERQ